MEPTPRSKTAKGACREICRFAKPDGHRLRVPRLGASRVRFDLMKNQFVATDADNDPIDFYLSGAPAGMAVDVTVHRRQGAGGGRG